MRVLGRTVVRNAIRSLSGLLHSTLSGLTYASAGHTGFEPTMTKGNLTAGTGITIGGTGTGAVIGVGASVTNSDTGSGAVSTHTSTYDHTKLHDRSHAITGTSDHTSSATSGQMLKANSSGLPVDATNTDTQVAAAVTASHARQHAHDATADHSMGSLTNTYLVKSSATALVNATNTDTEVAATVTASHAKQHAITATADHTSTATSGKMLKADTNGLPVDATNTDTQVSATVTASHARQHGISATADHTGVAGATTGHVVTLDANGLPADSGRAYGDFYIAETQLNIANVTLSTIVAGWVDATGVTAGSKTLPRTGYYLITYRGVWVLDGLTTGIMYNVIDFRLSDGTSTSFPARLGFSIQSLAGVGAAHQIRMVIVLDWVYSGTAGAVTFKLQESTYVEATGNWTSSYINSSATPGSVGNTFRIKELGSTALS